MTVYIEYALIDNFVIDYLLMGATLKLTKSHRSKKRIIFCAFLGAIVALIFPIISNLGLPSLIYKAISAPLLIFLLLGRIKGKEFLRNLVVFLLITFATGGGIMAVYSFFSMEYTSEIPIALMVVLAYILIKYTVKVIEGVSATKKIKEYLVDCRIINGDKGLRLKGLIDSGNSLYDGEKPVIVVSKKVGLKLASVKDLMGAKKIRVTTATGEGLMTVIEIERIEIYLKDKPNIYNNVTVGLIKGRGAPYEVILHPAYCEVENEDGNNREIKEVS